MWGWRGRIGYIEPGNFIYGPEFYSILPEGVSISVCSLSLEKLDPSEIERVSKIYVPAAQHLATQECNVIITAGIPMITYMGNERTQEMSRTISKVTGIPSFSDLEAVFAALHFLSAKRIVYVSPLSESMDKEIGKLFESAGFEVVNMKSLGHGERVEFSKQPSSASYRLAKQAFLESPDVDAIWILCPEWETVCNIKRLELDLGKPVVSHIAAMAWFALRLMNIKEPIKDCGQLLESI